MMDQYLKDNLDRNQLNTIDNAINEFPVSIKKKKKGTWRHIHNYVPVNQVCKISKYSIPNLRDKVNTLNKYKYWISLDLRAAHNQISFTDEKKKKKTLHSLHLIIYIIEYHII